VSNLNTLYTKIRPREKEIKSDVDKSVDGRSVEKLVWRIRNVLIRAILTFRRLMSTIFDVPHR